MIPNDPDVPESAPHRPEPRKFYPPVSRGAELPPPPPPARAANVAKLDYRPKEASSFQTEIDRDRRRGLIQFGVGACLGLIVSAIAYFGRGYSPDAVIGSAIVIALAKFLLSAVLVIIPRTKRIGIGLLVSLPLGFLLFFAKCASGLDLGKIK